MKLTTKQLVTVAVFGALWGLIEVSLGSVLHTLNVPMSGALLAGVGLVIALIGRLYVPQRGATLFMGVIAMALKLFSIGGVVAGPMVGILAEAILAEAVLSTRVRPTRALFLPAAALGVLWSLFQPFFTGLVLFGRDLVGIWEGWLDKGGQVLGLDPEAALWIVLALVGLHLLIGVVAGWIAWDAGQAIQSRLAAPVAVSFENEG